MREPIGKKLRFELFKRDSFTCQYCGRKAPDVILEADHIKPVATGGPSDITNLVTSCRDCNSGKGARELSDDTVIAKQRAQLEELNERRLQLEMMLEWREGLASIRSDAAQAVEELIGECCERHLSVSEHGRRNIAKWIKKYELPELLDAVQTSFDQYLNWEDGKPTAESWEKAFNYVPRVIAGKRRFVEKPYLKDLFYIRGILRNRLHYVNDQDCMALLERAHLAGASTESLMGFARSVRNWTNWRSGMVEFLDEHEEG